MSGWSMCHSQTPLAFLLLCSETYCHWYACLFCSHLASRTSAIKPLRLLTFVACRTNLFIHVDWHFARFLICIASVFFCAFLHLAQFLQMQEVSSFLAGLLQFCQMMETYFLFNLSLKSTLNSSFKVSFTYQHHHLLKKWTLFPYFCL